MKPSSGTKRLKFPLQTKLSEGNLSIAIIGMGYVGLPLAVAFAKRDIQVIGIDCNRSKVNQLKRGKSYIADVSATDIKTVVRKGRLKPTGDFDLLASADVMIVCVPTPLNRAKDPDLSFILDATEEIRKRLRRDQLVVLESTTYPGTTDEVILPRLKSKKLEVGKDFFLCFSPERIDPGNQKFSLSAIPKVVGGITPACTKHGAMLYQHIFDKVVSVSSARTAEMTKLLENTFRIVNIGLINELATVAGALNVDIWEAIDAAKTKPFGFMPFYPGPGVGGHCIGIDPVYLSWKAKTHGFVLRFIELAREINSHMPRYVVERIQRELAHKRGKAVNRSKVLVIGVSYKRDVADTRESPALEIIELLTDLGASVSYHDPYVPQIKYDSISLRSQALSGQLISKHDLTLVVTDHSGINYNLLAKYAPIVLDTRNCMRNYRSESVLKL